MIYSLLKDKLNARNVSIKLASFFSFVSLVCLFFIVPESLYSQQLFQVAILCGSFLSIAGFYLVGKIGSKTILSLLTLIALSVWCVMSYYRVNPLLLIAVIVPFCMFWNVKSQYIIANGLLLFALVLNLGVLAYDFELTINALIFAVIVYLAAQLFVYIDRNLREKLQANRLKIEQLVAESEQSKSALAMAEHGFENFIDRFIDQFKEPVNVMLGINNILQYNDTNMLRLDYLRRQYITGQYLQDEFNQLLSISTKKTPEIVLNNAPFKLSDVVTVLENRLTLARSEEQINTDVIFNDNLNISIVGDKFRITQVAMAMIDEGLSHLHHGGEITLTVVSEVLTQSDQVRMTFTVFHNSHIDPDHQPETSYGLSSNYFERVFDSLGYDLDFSQMMLQQMGSRLRIESDNTKGHRYSFHLVLPIAEQDTVADFKLSPDSGNHEWYGALRDMNIMVVDDSEETLFVVSELLALAGANVTTEFDGDQAVVRVLDGQTRFDAVIMDIQMANMNGIDATRAIRQQFNKFALPIMGLSISGRDTDVKIALEAGMNDYSIKPFNIIGFIEFLQHSRREQYGYNAEIDSENEKSLRLINIPDGFDIKLALSNLGGDKELYKSILEATLHDWSVNMDQLQGALKRNDIYYAQHVIARFSNNALMLGAVELDNYLRQLNFSLGLRTMDRNGGDDVNFKELAKDIEEHIWQTIAVLKSISDTL